MCTSKVFEIWHALNLTQIIFEHMMYGFTHAIRIKKEEKKNQEKKSKKKKKILT